MNCFRSKSTFCELANEIDVWTNGRIDLKSLLCDFKTASEIFSTHFQRSYSIDLHCDNIPEKKYLQIFKIINFFYSVDEEIAKSQISFLSDEKRSILRDIKKQELLFHAIFILILVGIIPTYTSHKGSAYHLIDDFHLLMNFLREYGKQAPTDKITKDSPILSRYENYVKEGDANDLRRIDLIDMTTEFFNVVSGFSSPDNAYLLNQQMNRLFPPLDGFWSDNIIPGSLFWKYEELSNGYFLYRYELKDDGKLLEYTKYECYIYGEDKDDVHFYVCHPTMMRKLVEQTHSDYLREWADGDVEEDKNGNITKLTFYPSIRSNAPILPKSLYRIENKEYYNKLLENSNVQKNNIFANDEYSLILNAYAITHSHLYIKLEDDDLCHLQWNGTPSSVLYLKIPKSLNPNLERLSLQDDWGICRFIDGDSYFAVVDSLLFFKINTESEREKLRIEIVDKIE